MLNKRQIGTLTKEYKWRSNYVIRELLDVAGGCKGEPFRTRGVDDFVVAAVYITERIPDLQVPDQFSRALDDAIRLRHLVSAHFMEIHNQIPTGDDLDHQHFTLVLEKVRRILTPIHIDFADLEEFPMLS